MKAVCLMVALCLAVAFAASNPTTKLQFQASYQETITMSMGGSSGMPGRNTFGGQVAAKHARAFGDITITDQGTLYYDGLNRIMKQDVSSITFDFGTGPQTQKVSITSLLMFDLGKNYTYDANTCSCDALVEDELPVFYLSADALAGGSTAATITVSGTTYNTQLYKQVIEYFGTSQTISFYVDGAELRRTTYAATAAGVSTTYQFDMWNVVALADSTVFTPSSKCVCPAAAPAQVDTTPTFPTTCGTAITGCQCATTVITDPNALFCGAYLKYQIDANTFIDFTDAFVKTTYDSISTGSTNTDCNNKLKEFLCHFYFPQCQTDAPLKPVAPDFGSCGAKFSSNDAVNTYTVATDTNKQNSGSSSDASTLAVSAFVAVAALAAAF